MLLLDSTYRVQQISASKLEIIPPPSGTVWLLFALAAMVTMYFLFRIYKGRSLYPIGGILLFGTPLVLVGLNIYRAGSLNLDKDTNTLTLRQPALIWSHNTTVPLDRVQHAELQTMGINSEMALVLKHADTLTFGYSTELSNKEQVVAVINRFLKPAVPVR